MVYLCSTQMNINPEVFRKMCKNVIPTEAARIIEENKDMVILDVRTPKEYDFDGHIEGSRLIPINEITQRLNELKKDDKIMVYCRTGNRSQMVCQFLTQQGYNNVFNEHGGIVNWARSGLKLVGQKPKPPMPLLGGFRF